MLTWTVLARMAIIASLPLMVLPQLPTPAILLILACTGFVFLQFTFQPIRMVGVAILLMVWMLNSAQHIKTDIEGLAAKPGNFTVRIDEVRQKNKQIKVRLLREGTRYTFPPRFAWISFNNATNEYCPGQRWNMQLRLRPVHARLNEGEFDSQRFALANHTPLQGRIVKQTASSTTCSWRWRFIQHHEVQLRLLPQQATLKALAFGIRDDLSKTTRQLLRDTGTAHLMAISGMHIALAAGLGWLLARGTQFLLPARFIGYLYPLLASWILAAIYTWLSGSHAPAQRALLALTLWIATRITAIQLSSWQVWTLCIGSLLAIDPITVLSDSFWLSTSAVGMLLIWYHWFPLPARFKQQPWLLLQLLRLVHLQIGMMILMAPLQVSLFNGISLTALLANLIAVPVVSFMTVPLILIAMMLPVASGSAIFWWLADLTLRGLIDALTMLPSGWWPLYHAEFFAVIIWGGLFIWRTQIFYCVPLSCCSLAIALLFSRQEKAQQGWRIDMLDVGHGLSVVISQGKEAVLYDTGPRWQTDDAGRRVVVPWLERKQLQLQQIILSHRHLDHSGGLESIKQRWPQIKVRSALNNADHLPCARGAQWQWRQLHFKVLWPLSASAPGDNNDSCVLSVDDGKVRLLLTGDIEAIAERQLVKLEKQNLKADVIQVPHHGSRTSSTTLLLRNINGHTAIASLARYNAWRMPAKSVLENYRKNGFNWFDTGQSGQISITINNGKTQVAGLREQLMPRWYHQWFGVKRESR
ncbi:MAG: DNA internalization-related competence protein ComEC/Rec2 [Enterobacterales bacterium endosymbiont of Blomia tropicalis]|uniref:DNA internalization-related competence protein ComEC/Rec2 n=1 Tax=Mixta mediterraneensis TaxID=2758443 RepID=UPI0025A808C3|nr:DNA internalization-related competence protein ComEC/Rec2 [Mixta mediterraneensis]MDL4913386.1 DNA internalization-related competence protein ComEC/Rec2 [Mixta mediterraneensis]